MIASSMVVANHPGEPSPGMYRPDESVVLFDVPMIMITKMATMIIFTISRANHPPSRRMPCSNNPAMASTTMPASRGEPNTLCPNVAAAVSIAAPTDWSGQNSVDQVTNFVVTEYRKSPMANVPPCISRWNGAKSNGTPPEDRTCSFWVAPDHRSTGRYW